MSRINHSEDNVFGSYVPIERPSVIPPVSNNKEDTVINDSGSESCASSSDYDSDLNVDNRVKKKIKINHLNSNESTLPVTKRDKKSGGWMDFIQDDILNGLSSCCTNNGRDVESYDYKMRKREKCYLGEEFQLENETKKRKRSLKKTAKNAISLPELDTDFENVKVMIDECSDAELAVNISKCLNETAFMIICRAVEILGKEKCVELYNRTKKIEQNGGLLTEDKQRRRTSGGIFMFLIKTLDIISRKQKNYIFEKCDTLTNRGRRQTKRKKYQMKKQFSRLVGSSNSSSSSSVCGPISGSSNSSSTLSLNLNSDHVSYNDPMMDPNNLIPCSE